jgi:hypothetical protein
MWEPLTRLGVSAVVLGLSLVLSACGSQTTTTSTAASVLHEPTTTTLYEPITSTTSLPAATSGLAAEETRLENGHIKVAGFIDRAWDDQGKPYFRIDFAKMLTGQEAVDAAIAAGELEPGAEYIENDYFIVNESAGEREFQLADTAGITAYRDDTGWGSGDPTPLSWAVFESFFGGSPPEGADAMHDALWWIERDGQNVVRIDQQYLP